MLHLSNSRDLGKRIVEVEMELTLAKSRGYLRNQFPQNGSLSAPKLLAVIGVYTGFGSRLKRNTFRGSWMPRGQLVGSSRLVLISCEVMDYDFFFHFFFLLVMLI